MPDRVLDNGLGQSRFSVQGVQRPKSAALIDLDNSCQNGKLSRSQVFALDLSHCVIPRCTSPAGVILSRFGRVGISSAAPVACPRYPRWLPLDQGGTRVSDGPL